MYQNKISLTLQEHHHEELQSFLFAGDGKEAVAIILCSKVSNHGRTRLLSNQIFCIPYQACYEREADTVRWPTSIIEPALDIAAAEGLSVVKIHSHPLGTKRFSRLDDMADKALFPSIDCWVNHPVPHASVVMLPDGSIFGRTVNAEGGFHPLEMVSVAGDNLDFWFCKNSNDNVAESGKRIAQAFGDATYNTMRKLRIGVVGCSGTGVPFITAMDLNHVGELFLVDPDVIEEGNRNRIATATPEDITQATPKVINQRDAIHARGLGTKVTTFKSDICEAEVIMALASCDIIIGCVDGATGRHILNKISSCFLIPYFDLGVRIDADGTGEITGINASMHFIKPSGSSLLSRGVYTMAQLDAEAMKETDPEEYEKQRKAGYVKGLQVDRPAVASVNGTISYMLADEIISRLNNYRLVDNGDFAIRRFVFSMGELLNEADDGIACPAFLELVARGDAFPLLGLYMMGEAA